MNTLEAFGGGHSDPICVALGGVYSFHLVLAIGYCVEFLGISIGCIFEIGCRNVVERVRVIHRRRLYNDFILEFTFLLNRTHYPFVKSCLSVVEVCFK